MATINPQQILVPKKVYIGDAAELRISFNSTQEILNYNWMGDLNLQDYSIQNVQITKSGLNYYQMTINFVPWKTGNLQFPKMELITAAAENSEQVPAESLILKTEPVQIVSLVEQNQITGLRGASNPMLIPGTTYKLYGTCIAIVLILIVLIRLIVKRKNVALYLETKKIQRKFRKNKRQTLKALSLLVSEKKSDSNKDKSDKAFAASVQSILRNYLEVRFDYPFKNTVSSEILNAYKKTMLQQPEALILAQLNAQSEKQNTSAKDETEESQKNAIETVSKNISDATKQAIDKLIEDKLHAAEVIAEVFNQTDYIRYGNQKLKDSTDNGEISEKNQIIDTLKTQIEILETSAPKVVDIH